MMAPRKPGAGPRTLDDIHHAMLEHLQRDSRLSSEPYLAPREGVEAGIAQVWAEVLGCERVGRQDDFFRIGGNSIRAAQVVSLLRARMGLDVPLREIFDTPRLDAFAARTGSCIQASAGVEIGRVGRDEPLPLSHAQERVWFLGQLHDDSAYNIALALRLRGTLDVELLHTALRGLVARHESLRTTFVTVDAQPRQVIAAEVDVLLNRLEPVSAREELHAMIRREAARRFDLRVAPLLRAALVHVGQAEHVLLLTMHHVVSDGWSIGILVEELAHLYNAAVAGDAPSLAPLPLQYADVTVWQRQQEREAWYAAERDYWRKTLAGAPTLLELPADRSRPAVMQTEGGLLDLSVGRELTSRLKAVGAGHGATLFMTLLAAFKVLLVRYTGQEDLCVGVPVAGRNRTEFERIVGFFANTVVLRTRVRRDATFVEYLCDVKAAVLGAFANQSVPFEQVVQDLAPERSLAHTPLFQVMFILQNMPTPEISLPGLDIELLQAHPGSTKFDLTCSVRERKDGLQASFEFARALFDAATVERMARHYVALLEAIAQAPEVAVGALPMLSESERHGILVDWNRTARPFSRDRVHRRVQRWARETPDAVAIVHERTLTYKELDERAEALTQALRGAGVGPRSIVAICLERGPDMIAAVLAVWKAGAAYVPLDPHYPAGRLEAMLTDANPAVVLTQEALVTRLPSWCPLVRVDDPDLPVAGAGSMPVLRGECTGETAYVIYTSGSTGKPKGVMVPHDALCNFLDAMQAHLAISPPDAWLAVTSLSFDIAGLELLLPLAHGARVVIATLDDGLDGARLDTLARQHGVTVMQGTPATWMLMRENGPLSRRLRLAICGGEAWGASLADYLCENAAVVLNAYGPTETTVWSTLHACRAGEPPTLGRPIANTQIYILDAALQPVPVGVAGELYIGGAGLAQGYLNLPDLTNERFIAHPFDEAPARLYRTGDLARYLRDGQMEFLGRCDAQVKLRGFRIEPGEIETVLQEHPQVVQAAVVLAQTAHGKHLAAFVVLRDADDGQGERFESIRAELLALARSRLPEYMAPAVFGPLRELPLTPNGKTDRSALAAAASRQEPRRVATPSEPCRTPTEESVCGIVAGLLERERASPCDDFFEMGGHSLLGMRLLARVNSTFSVHITVRELFDSPTPRQLALLVDQALLLRKLTGPRSTDGVMEVQEF